MERYPFHRSTTVIRSIASRRQGVVPRRAGRGFTLVELLIALVVSAMVTAGVAAMVSAVSYGTSSNRDLRVLLVRAEVIDSRISEAVRECNSILAGGTDFLVLWVEDTDDDDTTDNAEVRLIERDPATNVVNNYRNTGVSGEYTDAATFRTTALASYTPQPWTTGVTAISFVLDATPPNAKLATYNITLQDRDLSETVIGVAATRN